MLALFRLRVLGVGMMLILQAAGCAHTQDPMAPRYSNRASTYVPMDSWADSTFEEIAAEGYRSTAFFSLRPRTCMDCARLLDAANEPLADSSASSNASSMNVSRDLLSRGSLRVFHITAALAICAQWQPDVAQPTVWWQFPLLTPHPRRNAELTLQLSCRSLAKAIS